MQFAELLDTEEAEVLALVDDWLSTTPEIFGDDDPYADFDDDVDDDFLSALLREDN